MAKNNNKTTENELSVEEYLANIASEQKRADSERLLAMMSEITGKPAKMWGPRIVGFGKYKYRYESGREGEWFLCGFAAGKAKFSLYIMGGFEGHDALMERLGKHKVGKSCLYVNKLADVDLEVLGELVKLSAEHVLATSVE